MLERFIANKVAFHPDPSKRKILWVGEFSGAHTGFAHMAKHYLSYLFNTGKYNIVELCTGIGWSDPKTSCMPWAIAPNSPKGGDTDPLQGEMGQFSSILSRITNEQERQSEHARLLFGKFKYRDVIREYQPDIILDGRDIWNMDWELTIPETQHSVLVWQPMIDGNPHPHEWLEVYKRADHMVAFSHFAKHVLRNEGGIRAIDVIPAGVNIQNFKPLHSRKEILESFGLQPNLKVFGFVARNQIRKRFPELISAFATALAKSPKLMRDARLLLYTNYEDAGWPMHEQICKAGIQNFVLVPLVCQNCRSYTVIQWVPGGWEQRGGRTFRKCSKCKQMTLCTPSTDLGLSEPEFNVIYNMMYWYVHLASREGQGLPVCESKAAGLPGAYNDAAALTEQAGRSENAWEMPTGAWLIRNRDSYIEVSTRMSAACPDKAHTAEMLLKAIKLPQDQWEQMSEQARTMAEKCYDWDIQGKKWERILDTVPLKPAPLPMVLMTPQQRKPNPNAVVSLEMQDAKEWVRGLFKQVLDTSPNENNDEFTKWCNTAEEGAISRGKMVAYFQKIAYRDLLQMGQAPEDVKRILYVMPRTAGDVFVSTAVCHGIKAKYPNCQIDFATLPIYMEIIEGCPWIDRVIPFEDMFMDHRQWEGIFNNKAKYEIVFTPSLVTQQFPHSHFHGGKNQALVEAYANFCNVHPGEYWVNTDEGVLGRIELPQKYVVFHAKTGMASKDYALWKFVVDFLDYPVVQVGSKDDYSLITTNPRLKDAKGLKWAESFAIVKHAAAFMGGDSVVAHIARHFNIPAVVPFGATLPNKVYEPRQNDSVIPLNPTHRGDCINACHLSFCPQKVRCVNYVEPERILENITKVLGIQRQGLKTKFCGLKCQDYEFHFHFDGTFDPNVWERPVLQFFSRTMGLNRYVHLSNRFILGQTSQIAELLQKIAAPILVLNQDIDRTIGKIISEHQWTSVIFDTTNTDFCDETQRALVSLISSKIPVRIVYRGHDQATLAAMRSRSLQRGLSIMYEPESKDEINLDKGTLLFSARYEIDEKGQIWFAKGIERPEEWTSLLDNLNLSGDIVQSLYAFEKIA